MLGLKESLSYCIIYDTGDICCRSHLYIFSDFIQIISILGCGILFLTTFYLSKINIMNNRSFLWSSIWNKLCTIFYDNRVLPPAAPGHALTSSTVSIWRCCLWLPSRSSQFREVSLCLSPCLWQINFCDNRVCHSGSHYWGDYRVGVCSSEVIATHLKIGLDDQMSCRDLTAWQATEVVAIATATRRLNVAHILQGCFTGTGAIIWLPQCQWSNPEECGQINCTNPQNKARWSHGHIWQTWDIFIQHNMAVYISIG